VFGGSLVGEYSNISRFEARLESLPWVFFLLGISGIGLVKAGISLLGTPAPLDSFPEPIPTSAAISYGNRTLAWILGWEFPGAYAVVSLFLTAITIVVLGIILRPSIHGDDGRIIATLVILGPIGQVLMTNVGGNDA